MLRRSSNQIHPNGASKAGRKPWISRILNFLLTDFFASIDDQQPMLLVDKICLLLIFTSLYLLSLLLLDLGNLWVKSTSVFLPWCRSIALIYLSFIFVMLILLKDVFHPVYQPSWVLFLNWKKFSLISFSFRFVSSEHAIPFHLFFLMEIFYHKWTRYFQAKKTDNLV